MAFLMPGALNGRTTPPNIYRQQSRVNLKDFAVTFEDPQHALTQIGEMNRMRLEKVFGGIVIVIGTNEYYAHRTVLASSSSVLEKKFKDNPDQQRVVLDMLEGHAASSAIVEPLLEFTYTGRIEITSRNVWELLVSSDTLEIRPVRSRCHELIVNSLSPSTCLSTLQTAFHYKRLDDLKDAVKKYCLQNLQDILDKHCDDFCHLPKDVVLYLTQYETLPAGRIYPLRNENALFDAMCIYLGKYKSNLDPEFLKELCSQLRPCDCITNEEKLKKFNKALLKIGAPQECMEFLDEQRTRHAREENVLVISEGPCIATEKVFSVVEKFSDIPSDPGIFVNGVDIYLGKLERHTVISAMQMHYSDGTKNMHGVETGRLKRVRLDEDERIIRVYARTGYVLDQITFETNKREFGPFGGEGGYRNIEDCPPVGSLNNGNEVKGWLCGIRGGLVNADGAKCIVQIYFQWAYKKQDMYYTH